MVANPATMGSTRAKSTAPHNTTSARSWASSMAPHDHGGDPGGAGRDGAGNGPGGAGQHGDLAGHHVDAGIGIDARQRQGAAAHQLAVGIEHRIQAAHGLL
jgi:hypothetical protein